MGRYAFFNTEFEYKFWFGIQSSEDITLFGGEDVSSVEKGPVHRWTTENDSLTVFDELRFLCKAFDYTMPEWEKFPTTLDGTYDLSIWICDTHKGEAKSLARFLLGCLIFHQLKYVPGGVLEARYEN